MFSLFANGVIDTDGKFAAGVIDTGCKFATGINDTSGIGGKFAASVYRWGTLTCKYLHEFWKKFEIALMLLSEAKGNMIHKKTRNKKLVTLSL